MRTLLRKAVAVAASPLVLALTLALLQAQPGYAQTHAQSDAQPKLAARNEPSSDGSEVSVTGSATANRPAVAPDPETLAKRVAAMEVRMAELEAELKAARKALEQAAPAASLVNADLKLGGTQAPASLAAATPGSATPGSATENTPPEKEKPSEPFAYADWTWLNGTPRTTESPLDSKYFTGEFRADTNYTLDANHPRDDSLGGSTETFRSDEIQVEQLSLGGDLHVGNVRGRILTMFGMFSTTTPRNDASVARGQWDLRDAYRYVSEAWGGYHWNVSHGLNLDAGIFVSYIGLFSYYNFDNWTYQPSYVSSNTPWFFNGIRIQWFPTDKLKIEPWIINGWQSYARTGTKPGLGGQILWRPKPWVSMVFNNYGMGEDTLGGNTLGGIGRSRIHTDDSIEVKYYDNKYKTLDKMAFSFTADAGCEYGGGVSCHGDTKEGPKQSFLGWMAYNRFWFKKDLYGFTLGGGMMNNPGRYLTLLPPINGADAISGSPYFTGNPGDPMKAWDTTATFDYMPSQFITFRWELGYRHANVPYWTGRGGITPIAGNNGSPGSLVPGTELVPGPFLSPTPGFTCVVVAPGGFCPDLRKDQAVATMAIMVKF